MKQYHVFVIVLLHRVNPILERQAADSVSPPTELYSDSIQTADTQTSPKEWICNTVQIEK